MDTVQLIKSKPLSKEETKALIGLIELSKIVTSKATNATSNKLKDEEWIKIAQQFNATATNCRRTPQQLRLKWENLKKNARKRCTKIRMNNIKTGGGVGDYIPPDEILDRVASLLGTTANGLVTAYGGDKEAEEFSIFGEVGCADGGVEEIGGDARVNLEILEIQDTPMPGIGVDLDPQLEMVVVPTPLHSATVQVKTCAGAEHVKSVDTPRRFTPRTGKRKLQSDGPKSARDLAVAEYYQYKKKCLEAKFENIILENQKLKLENEKLSLEIERYKKQI